MAKFKSKRINIRSEQNKRHLSHRWLNFLTIVAAINMTAIGFLIYWNGPSKMALLSLTYVCSTSFRSIFPQNVTERSTLRSLSPLSTSFNDRTVATIGELAFTYQLILHFNMPFGLFWMIALAQTVCWIAVLTGYPILHALENSLWGLLAVAVFFHCEPGNWIIQMICFIFCSYIVLGDIPLYLSKKNELSDVRKSLREIMAPAKYNASWEFWKHEVVWMTGYFTMGAWGSITIANKYSIQ